MKVNLKLIFAAVLLCLTSVAHAQDTKAQEERKARLEREIAIIDKQLAENASKSNTMLADLNLIRKKHIKHKASYILYFSIFVILLYPETTPNFFLQFLSYTQ